MSWVLVRVRVLTFVAIEERVVIFEYNGVLLNTRFPVKAHDETLIWVSWGRSIMNKEVRDYLSKTTLQYSWTQICQELMIPISVNLWIIKKNVSYFSIHIPSLQKEFPLLILNTVKMTILFFMSYSLFHHPDLIHLISYKIHQVPISPIVEFLTIIIGILKYSR